MKTNHFNLGVLIIAFFCSTLVFGQIKSNGKIKVFILAGQSNMDGRGDGSKLISEDLRQLEKAQKNIHFAYNRNPIIPLNITIPLAHTAKKFNLEKTFGPELFFGIEMAKKYPNEKFLFIKRSLGGTSLYGCWNPNWDEEKAAHMNELKRPKLYSDLLLYMKEVLADYNSDTYEFCGMLWVQGETDSGIKKFGTIPSEKYAENLTNLINGIRIETKVKDLPFLLLQVGGGKVVEGMKEVSGKMKNVTFIPQSSNEKAERYLPKYGPPIGHYTYEGMKTIGEWFADEFILNYGLNNIKINLR